MISGERVFHRQFLLICCVMALFIAAQSMAFLLVPLYALELGASAAGVGGLMSLAFVLPLFLAMPVGAFVDKLGSRGLIVLATAAMIIGPVVASLVPSLIWLAVAHMLVGMSHLVFNVSAQRFVSGMGAGRAGERNFGWYGVFQSAGQTVGPLLGGLLIDVAGHRPSFIVAGLLALVAFVLSLGLVASSPTGITGPVRLYGGTGGIPTLLGLATVRSAILVSVGVAMAFAALQAFFPVYLEQLDYRSTTIGLLISMRSLTSVLVRPVMPWFVQACGGRSLALLIMLLAVALGCIATAMSSDLWLLILAAMALGMGSGITQPLSIITVVDHVKPSQAGFALGLRLTGNRLAQSLSPLALGLVAEVAGVDGALLIAGVLLFIPAALVSQWRSAFEAIERGALPTEQA